MLTHEAAIPEGQAGPHIYLLGSSKLDRLAYRLLLRHQLNLDVAVESDFSPTSVWAALRSKPELALVDADQASPGAVDAVQMIVRLQPATRILIIGATVDPMDIRAWGRCKIHGYVVKDGGVDELRAACQAVLGRQQYYSEGIRNVVHHSKDTQREDDRPRLSRRETELLPLLARGMTLREAAGKMTVSYKTADSYRTSLLRKLGLHDRVELARYAIREHIVEV
jgi:DNA-binding NarL/FixJ family response regulator